MALDWLMDRKPKDDKKEEEDSIELKPGDVKAKLDKIDALESGVTELKSKSAILDRMATYLDEQERIKKDGDKKKKDEVKAQSDEDLEAEFLTDPANATRKLLRETMSPLVVTQVNTAATLVMRDMFNEEPELYKYASDPTIKKEVEQMVMTLPLDKRSDRDSIANCYYVAKGRHEKDIEEGKIKARASAASGGGHGTGGPSGTRQDDVVVLSESEKAAAKVFGMTEADYAKSKKELSYV